MKVKNGWRTEGLYKEEASVVCCTVLILCTVLEKTERTCCNVADSTSQLLFIKRQCLVLACDKFLHRLGRSRGGFGEVTTGLLSIT